MILKKWKNYNQLFLDPLFPPLCLHCKDRIEESTHLFCLKCIPDFELLERDGRCQHCFSKQLIEETFCSTCLMQKKGTLLVAAAFEHQGAIPTLIAYLKQRRFYTVAKTAAAWLVLQHEKLGWPIPDGIIPIPPTWPHLLFNGKDSVTWMAEELGKFLGVPVLHPLWRRGGSAYQEKKNKEQRLQLSSVAFRLKKSTFIAGKTLLIIDDIITTGTTLHACAEALRQEFPKKLYALALSKKN